MSGGEEYPREYPRAEKEFPREGSKEYPRINSGVLFRDPGEYICKDSGECVQEKTAYQHYHVWFPTKYRRRALVGKIDEMVQRLFREIAEEKQINLLVCGTMPEHAHLLLKLNVSEPLFRAVKLLKGISSRRIMQKFPMLKYQLHTGNLWAKGYGYKEISAFDVPNTYRYVRDQKKHLCEIDSSRNMLNTPHFPHHNTHHLNGGYYGSYLRRDFGKNPDV